MPIVLFGGNTTYTSFEVSADISVEHRTKFLIINDEPITVTDEIAGFLSTIELLSESARFHDVLQTIYGFVFSDSAQASISLTPQFAALLEEILTAHSDFSLSFDGSVILSESLSASDSFSPCWRELIAETANISDSHSILIGTVLSESLNGDDIMNAAASLSVLCQNSAVISDRLIAARIISELISETVTASDQALASVLFSCLLYEAATTEDTLTGLGELHAALSESATVSDAMALSCFFHEVLNEGLTASLSFRFPDGEYWQTWAISSSGHHVSVYSGYDFNSYAILNSIPYAAGSDGIYRLTEDDDDGQPIRTGIILSDTLLGSTSRKRFRKASFGITGHRPALKIESDGKEYIYKIENMEAYPSKRQGGNHWVLKVADFDTLDFVEFIPLILVK